jgi:large subunit ribosomal protein L15
MVKKQETKEEEKKKIVYLCRNFLNHMNKIKGTKDATRVGRGKGSGKGKTSGRGDKGQYARNQAPALRLIIKNLIRKLPKRGMPGKPVTTLTINMEQLKRLVENNDLKEVNNETVFKLLNSPKRFDKVKLIHNINVDKIPAVTLNINKISESAKAFIEKNKGKVSLIAE